MFWQERSSTQKATAQSSWRACVCDDIYYKLVSEVATDQCMKCPPGLVCHGDSTLEVVVAGSTWNVDGPVFRLQDCPFGFKVWSGQQGSFNAEVQQCVPCDKGEECTTPPCVSCTPCEPGYYKSVAGTHACSACPANTYRETPGASELGNCIPCLDKSSTRKQVAQSDWRACVCDDIYYRHIHDEVSDACQRCPPGLVCHGDSTLEVVVDESTWSIDGPIFRLLDCPYGYAVYNGVDADSFNAEVQRCWPCGKGEECTDPPCVSCTPCGPGFFKSAVGTAPCTACPANTYREAPGASELVNCKNCLVSILKSQLSMKLTI